MLFSSFHPIPGPTRTDGGSVPLASCQEWQAMPSCLMLLEQLMRAAASRTFCTAGKRRPIKIAMIAMTTSSSINVNPEPLRVLDMALASLGEMSGSEKYDLGQAIRPPIVRNMTVGEI